MGRGEWEEGNGKKGMGRREWEEGKKGTQRRKGARTQREEGKREG
jgi:hypothetical protein